jgi:uncharacterized repeat protein (TIGR02543 family)
MQISWLPVRLPIIAWSVLLASCLLMLNTGTARASIAYGSINNFDTVNDTGHECHGFEIDIEDCHSTDITYTYDYNHYSTSQITEDDSVPGHPKCIVRWESKKNPDGTWAAYTAIPSGAIAPTDGHMFTDPSVNFGGEHFGVGYNIAAGAVTYNWLIDDGSGNLMKGGAVQVSTPTFTYYPPVVGNAAPPQVQAVIAPPPPPAPVPNPKEFGNAIWVKEIRTTAHNNHEVKLRDLVSEDPSNPNGNNWKNGEADEVETEWQILQKDYGQADGGVNNEVPAAAEGLPNGDEVVTRRYEFYKYTGPFDAETGEALAETVGPDGIHGIGIRTVNGVSVDLSTVAIVGDFTGAQMAAVGVVPPIALIDHVSEGRVNDSYAARTIVIPGAYPFYAIFDGVLPSGMSFDEVTGILSGTPSESGQFNFNITVSNGVNPDVSKNYTLIIAAEGAVLPPSSLLDTAESPVGSGTTAGDGAYAPGSIVMVNASPAAGFQFVNWTDNGTVVSSSTSYTFIIDVNHSLVAHFSPIVPQRTITTGVTPDACGTTGGGGVVDDGSVVTVTATANLGYAFSMWTEGGVQVSNSPSYAFTASADRALIASFTPVPVYTVSTGVNFPAGGTAAGGGSFSGGSKAIVTATANAGYVFMRWTVSGTQVSTSPAYSFSVTGNKTLVANFIVEGTQQTISTSANPVAGGTTSGGGIYASGDSATVVATAKPGYVFSKWQEGNTTVSTSPSYTFTVGGSRTLVAKFNVSFVVGTSSSPAAGGTTEMDSQHYNSSGETAQALAQPSQGYSFANWTENGVVVSASSTYSFKVTGNRTLVANFLSNTDVTVNTNSATADGGTTIGDGAYLPGDEVTVSALPNDGSGFVNWTEDGLIVSNDPDYTFTADVNHALVAHFAPAVAIDETESPAPGGSVSGAGSYGTGAIASLVASPNPGYVFANWTDNGKVVSSSPGYNFTVTAARALVANFSPSFTIDAAVATGTGGSVAGAASYSSGASVTLTATPDAGYRFVNWTENGVEVSTSSSYSFTAGADRSVVANFTLIIPQLLIQSPGPGEMSLTWPADLPGWVLEESPDLSPGSWFASTRNITLSGSLNQVTVSPVTGNCFFRLSHP